MKRSGKFYRKNEKEVMESLGLKPTPNSGSGWVIKEDGQNDYIIAQLKSTDAQSIKINQRDLVVLEQNAAVAHKVPVFAIQFLNTNQVFIMMKPEDLNDVNEYIYTGKKNIHQNTPELIEGKEKVVSKPKVVSSGSAREKFHEQRLSVYDKTKKAT